ncbi:sensor domain-containing diguanylate cyclase [Poseidonibacter sp.]|uniref:sensor domain-containing diguanylate cyclase n=1 Tax=Poseidonibacter sp. TaxID=2321188 RepID=UPI003C73C8EF
MQNDLENKELKKHIIELEKKLSIMNMISENFVKNNKLLELLLNTIPSPIFYKDIDGIYQKCNDSFSNLILGLKKEEIIGKSLFDLPELIPNDLAQLYYEKDQELFKSKDTQFYESRVLCSDKVYRDFCFYKAVLLDDKNNSLGMVGIMLDVTDFKSSQKKLKKSTKKLKEKNLLLKKLSYKDSLTGLFNKRKFDYLFEHMLNTTKRHKFMLNFAIIDVDNFKLYNDTYGHDKGDIVLKKIAKTMMKVLARDEDYYFRLGGEEFGLLFYSNNKEDAFDLTEKLRKKILKLNIKDKSANKKVSVSIGLITIKNKDTKQKTIYKKADKLLYKVKKDGKNKTYNKEI